MAKPKPKFEFEIGLQSKNYDIPGMDMPRDFGGVIPGSPSKSIKRIEIRGNYTDARIMAIAKKRAEKENRVLVEITKTRTIYKNWLKI